MAYLFKEYKPKRSIEIERKRKRKRTYSSIFVAFSLIFFVCSLIFFLQNIQYPNSCCKAHNLHFSLLFSFQTAYPDSDGSNDVINNLCVLQIACMRLGHNLIKM